MGPGTPRPLQRTWAVTIHPHCGELMLRCTACGPLSRPSSTSPMRRMVLTHLAGHASRAPLLPHLRTCRCREDGCLRHPRHRGCDGPLLLLLTRDPRGRVWNLADTCRACATVTPHSARVPETSLWGAHEASNGFTPGAPYARGENEAILPPAHASGPDGAPAGDGDVLEEGMWWFDDAEAYDWPM